MSMANILEILVVAAIVAVAILVIARSFRKKKCSCGCASTGEEKKPGSCAGCPADRDD